MFTSTRKTLTRREWWMSWNKMQPWRPRVIVWLLAPSLLAKPSLINWWKTVNWINVVQLVRIKWPLFIGNATNLCEEFIIATLIWGIAKAKSGLPVPAHRCRYRRCICWGCTLHHGPISPILFFKWWYFDGILWQRV